VELISLRTRNFRNLASLQVAWSGGANLVLGGNGEGKTNLLEAVAVLGNLRSFRTTSLRRVVRHGESSLAVEGELNVGGARWRLQQVLDVGPPLRRELSINGGRVAAAHYLTAFPVFAISPTDRDLVVGKPSLRRAYLDRLAFLLEPTLFEQLRAFRRALRQRNAALVSGAGNDELATWDEGVAAGAARVVRARLAVMERIRASFGELYEMLRGRDFPDVGLAYRGDSWWRQGDAPEPLQEAYLERLQAVRGRDRQVGYTMDGPHRHDVLLRVDGRSGRDVLSSGQIKVVAAALRLASLAEVERERDDSLPVIVDDVDAELDRTVLSKLVAHLGCGRQLFLSSAHEEMVSGHFESAVELWMRQGTCNSPRDVERAHD